MITFNKIGKMGRFGNQLFQYATLFALAKEKNLLFGIPNNRHQNEYYDCCLFDAFKNLSATVYKEINYKNYYEEKIFNYDSKIFEIEDDTDICGFFQSEKYFKKYKNDILREFTFKDEIVENAKQLRNNFDSCVSLHVRLTDYLVSNGKHPICTLDYYNKALDRIPKDVNIILFSDDTQLAIQYLKLNKNINILNIKNKFIEMCFMTMCDYHILANSSFSWWGSWLSNSKLTIAPKQWFGQTSNINNWDDIYCDAWEIL